MGAATPGKGATAAVLALVMWSTGCSTSPAPSPSERTDTCFSQSPPAWTTGPNAITLALPSGVSFGLGALAGENAYGQMSLAGHSGIASVDLTTGAIASISAYDSDVGGLGGMAVDPPWLVWEQLDSQTDQANWSVRAWNESTGASFVLGTSRQQDGTFLHGQQPLPVVRAGMAAWAEPVAAPVGQIAAQVVVLNLVTGDRTTLDTGLVSSPVYAGQDLIWAKKDGAAYSFHAVSATTWRPTDLPDVLRSPGSIGYLAGSSSRLLWSNDDYTTLSSWEIGSPRYRRFVSDDHYHFFQFLQSSGDFAAWFGGATSSVLDLRTGMAFDVPGTVAASTDRIAIGRPTGGSATEVSASSAVMSFPVEHSPMITKCAK